MSTQAKDARSVSAPSAGAVRAAKRIKDHGGALTASAMHYNASVAGMASLIDRESGLEEARAALEAASLALATIVSNLGAGGLAEYADEAFMAVRAAIARIEGREDA